MDFEGDGLAVDDIAVDSAAITKEVALATVTISSPTLSRSMQPSGSIFLQGENPGVYAVIRNQRFLIARQT